MLLRDGDSGLAKLVQQSVFIDFLKESGSQRVEHRQGAANDSFGQEVNPVLADIHLRVLRVLRFHFPCLLPALEPNEFGRVHVCPGSAQRGLFDRKENGTANHANHAKGDGALQGQDDAFDLKARLAEVE
jgi:hypothetical protein